MLDCRGRLISPGDTIAVASQYGYKFGIVLFDPDDIRHKRLYLRMPDGRIKRFKKVSKRMLNLSGYFRDEVDTSLRVVVD